MAEQLLSIEDVRRMLGVSRSTVWRLISRGESPSVRRGGRRLIPAKAVQARSAASRAATIAEFTPHHAMFRLIGAARGGRHAPGARDKHAILDE